MKLLLQYYKFVLKYKAHFVFSLILITTGAVAYSSIPIFLKYMIEAVQENRTQDALSMFFLLCLIKPVELIVKIAGFQLADEVIIQSAADIRRKVFQHIHNLDLAFHSNKSSGELISIFKRGQGAFINLSVQLNIFIPETIVSFIVMILTFATLYEKLLYITLGIFVINAIAAYFTLRLNIRKRRKLNKIDDKTTKVVVDNMIAYDTVKYFTNEKYEEERLRDILKVWKKKFRHYVYTYRVIDGVNGGIIQLGMLFVIGVSIYDYTSGIIPVSDFILSTSFATLFFPNMQHLLYNVRSILTSYADMEKYLNVLDEKIEIKDTPIKATIQKWYSQENKSYDIEFKDISFSYDGKNNVLEDINVKINPGESVALVGPSGSGKTTFTRLLMRFYDPKTGEVLINGIPITTISKTDLRAKIGIVPQDASLFNNSLKYNISYGKKSGSLDEKNDYENALKNANLKEFVESLPDKSDTIVGERGVKLSGGQKQRVSIARAFLENAPIVIFDEATSSLDSHSEKLIQDAFWKMAKDKTTIVIAHRLSTIQKVDRILVFKNGRIVEQGSHADLISKGDSLYKYLWELQTKEEDAGK